MQTEMWGKALENRDPSLSSVIAFAENIFQIAFFGIDFRIYNEYFRSVSMIVNVHLWETTLTFENN